VYIAGAREKELGDERKRKEIVMHNTSGAESAFCFIDVEDMDMDMYGGDCLTGVLGFDIDLQQHGHDMHYAPYTLAL
jgi:hypothetical protein